MRNLLFVSTVLLISSCNNSNIPDRDTSLSTGHDTLQSVVGNTASPENGKNTVTIGNSQNAAAQPVQIQPQQGTVQNANIAQQITAAKQGAAGLNPAHGQPGHRCDIPVGAPLNSPPGKTTQPQATITQSQPQATNIKVAPGMNPPHGQPGHRCDIPVGAPLNSKPATPTQAATPTTTIVTTPLAKPVTADGAEKAVTDSSKH